MALEKASLIESDTRMQAGSCMRMQQVIRCPRPTKATVHRESSVGVSISRLLITFSNTAIAHAYSLQAGVDPVGYSAGSPVSILVGHACEHLLWGIHPDSPAKTIASNFTPKSPLHMVDLQYLSPLFSSPGPFILLCGE